MIVIAFCQKLAPALLDDIFAVNLHASLLPRYRGAAPVNWAMINGEAETGVSVITISQRIDAGDVLDRSSGLARATTVGLLQLRTRLRRPELPGKVHPDGAGIGILAGHTEVDVGRTDTGRYPC